MRSDARGALTRLPAEADSRAITNAPARPPRPANHLPTMSDTHPPTGHAAPPPDDDDPLARVEDRAFSVQILQFFLFPLLLVITCLAIFVLFGLAKKEPNIERLMSDLARGGQHARAVSAYELSKLLGEDALRARAGQAPRYLDDETMKVALLGILADEREQASAYLGFVALAGAYTRDARFVDPILARLRAYYVAHPPDQPENLHPRAIEEDPEVTYYTALRQIAAPTIVAPLAEWMRAGDVDTRKLAVWAIGSVETPEATAVLHAALDDDHVSVRGNAALQLAARSEPAAAPMIARLLDPAYVGDIPGITDLQRREWLMNACAAAATLRDPTLEQSLRHLEKSYSDPRVVNAARKALDHLATPAP